MNKTEEILLTLLASSLWNNPRDKSEKIDWEAVYREASLQSVLGIIAKVVPESVIDSPDSKWKNYNFKQLSKQIIYYEAQDNLNKILCDNKIKYAILKGSAAAINYSDPYCRTMGDIDFIVLPEQFEFAKKVLADNGYVFSDIQSPRHLHIKKEDTCFELHQWFSYDGLDIEDHIHSGLLNLKHVQFDNHEFYMLPEIENGLVLLTHVWRHLQSGLGLRQIIDWLMYVNKYLDDECWNNHFREIVKEKGLEKLAVTLTRTCQLYLGLSDSITWCQTADDDVCAVLIESVLAFGNFGKKEAAGTGRTLQSVAGIKDRGIFRHLQIRGKANWQACHKHRWLIPFAWLYQLLRYFRKGFHANHFFSVFYGIKKSNQHYSLLKSLGITISNNKE